MARLAGSMFTVLVLVLCVLVTVECRVNRLQAKVDPEVHMNTSQLITSKDYPCEEYDVHTKDGYILGIQRIPRGRNDTSGAPRPVVFLQHGLLSCSACWVENLVNESLGFMLADAGFDVWLGNSRGNTYSKRHERLKPDQKEFWEFSWDEMAMYDIPATIERILNVSKASHLFFVGHSLGGTIGFGALAYDWHNYLNDKIKLFVPLAPITVTHDTRSPLKLLAPFADLDNALFDKLGNDQFMPKSEILTWLASEVCDKGLIPERLCSNILFIIAGYDYKYMNESRIPVYVGQHPAGTSVKTFIHLLQQINGGDFQMMDFGIWGNYQHYNTYAPPIYNVTKITVPIAMYSGANDWIVGPDDVNTLSLQLRKLVLNKVIDEWEHFDFVWAMNAPQALYYDVISLFKKYI